eukprot:14948177-Alexandrium_andersonii.AAC.1
MPSKQPKDTTSMNGGGPRASSTSYAMLRQEIWSVGARALRKQACTRSTKALQGAVKPLLLRRQSDAKGQGGQRRWI